MKKILVQIIILLNTFIYATETRDVPVLILGGGPAGLTAAIYCGRSGIKPVVITGDSIGGMITQSPRVENWPGRDVISGIELGKDLENQARLNGAELLREEVIDVVLSHDLFQKAHQITTRSLITQEEVIYYTSILVVALGATPNKLHVPGEQSYWSKGVYSCAVCDGGFYKDKTVAVVGGGDGALTEAQYLANLAKKVYIIVRGRVFRTVEKQREKQVVSLPNIEVLYQTIVKEIKGEKDRVSYLILSNQKHKKSYHLPVDALFLAIGSVPNTELFASQLELDSGYIRLKEHQKTSIKGVYAAGEVADPEFKQAVCAAADGAKAAMQLQKEINKPCKPCELLQNRLKKEI
ncbi:Thioredoxin reductase [Candidatus Rhabdochlamydia oedothoracis]|uniref:Thioredoxin reductase n=1 Tax=Candidatus Rhabdochlamydia oedothoracis TaxID=2720720 RepID=A0ABX8UZY9_9BACT|nr:MULTISPECIES: FAD-dependent oxidoreductase [Rhabdochlamydia]KAG6558987.1 Thioredoxin reductase [Candidatus Rhabdochlamydia sp. W815]QYF48196.1 Thioredoxin reductase [Candidatus Rhabdochlamydia oedothoracis]